MTILKSVTVPVTATGANGTASGNADSETFVGEIVGAQIAYHANTPNTADLTITDKRSGTTILSRTNGNTDEYATPRQVATFANGDNVLSATENGLHPTPFAVDQGVNVALAQANTDTNGVVVTILYRK